MKTQIFEYLQPGHYISGWRRKSKDDAAGLVFGEPIDHTRVVSYYADVCPACLHDLDEIGMCPNSGCFEIRRYIRARNKKSRLEWPINTRPDESND